MYDKKSILKADTIQIIKYHRVLMYYPQPALLKEILVKNQYELLIYRVKELL